MKTPKRTLIAIIALSIAAPAMAQVRKPPAPPKPPKPPRAEARFEETARQTLHVPNVTELELSNISGDVVISPGSGKDASIEVIKRGFGDTQEEAREQLGMLTVTLEVDDRGRGEVGARYNPRGDRRRRNFRSAADYTVTAPPGTIITVNTVSGDISATRMKGELSLQSVSGDVTLESPGRVTAAKSVSGDVRISGAALDAPLAASSVSGAVRLESLKARRVEANSISGDVIMRDLTCDRVSAQTISGNVEFSGSVAPNGRYEMQAHSGDIRFTVSGNRGFEVDADSFSGNIRSELPIRNLAHGAEDEDEDGGLPGMPKRAAFRGTYGDGSATVELSTFSGNIVITK